MKDDLKEIAERMFPFPKKYCRLIKAKIEWKREQWINKQKTINNG